MNSGKVSNSVLKRSVLKNIKKNSSQMIDGPGIGLDCGIMKSGEDTSIAVAVSDSMYAVYHVANNLAAYNAQIRAITDTIVMPCDFDEKELKHIVRRMQEQSTQLDIDIISGNTRVSKAVISPVISITGIGEISKNHKVSPQNIISGLDIVMTKWIGIETARIICEKDRESLLKRFQETFILSAEGKEIDLSVIHEAAIAANEGAVAMHDVSEGGIFGALWDLAEAGGVGLEINLKAISVKQEIIEICEVYDINPYETASSGCMLIVCENGYRMSQLLQKEGILAGVIGKTTDSNDKMIWNEDEKRFLEPPKKDEIYRFIME